MSFGFRLQIDSKIHIRLMGSILLVIDTNHMGFTMLLINANLWGFTALLVYTPNVGFYTNLINTATLGSSLFLVYILLGRMPVYWISQWI